MANILFINMVKVETLGTNDAVMYGYTASDEYASAYDFSYRSLEELYEAFPDEDALKRTVLSLPEFIDVDDDTASVYITFAEKPKQ